MRYAKFYTTHNTAKKKKKKAGLDLVKIFHDLHPVTTILKDL